MLREELKNLLEGDVAADSKTLEKYSRDYSMFEIKPQIAVFPKNTEDVKRLVKFASRNKKNDRTISLTARAAGTDMSGGPLNESVILDFTKYFNHIKEVGGDYAIAEPGVYFRDFEKELDKKNLLYPPYPASKDLCALGGIVSNNSGGEKTLVYGQTRKYIEEIKIVMADGEEHLIKPMDKKGLAGKLKEKNFEGEIYRKIYKLISRNYEIIKNAKPKVSKNSAGYALWEVWDKKTFDLGQLIIGAQGTLGIITEARFRLLPKKKVSRLAVVFIHNPDEFGEIIDAALSIEPETLEFYDDKTASIAIRFLPDLIKTMREGFIRLAWSFLPEFWMAVKGGMPKLVLLIETAGDRETDAENRLVRVKEKLSQFNVQTRILRSEKEAKKYWTVRRASFELLHKHNRDKATVPFIDDIIVPPEKLASFLPEINAIIGRRRNKMIYTIAGHAGDGNLHIIPLMDLKDPETRKLIPEVADEVYRLVVKYKGSITAEHNDGIIRTPYLELMYGKKINSLFREVKDIFDPQNIFNPGKKVGIDKEWSARHIKTG